MCIDEKKADKLIKRMDGLDKRLERGEIKLENFGNSLNGWMGFQSQLHPILLDMQKRIQEPPNVIALMLVFCAILAVMLTVFGLWMKGVIL